MRCVFKIYLLFIYDCVGSSFLCEGFLLLWQAGATLHRSVWASHCRGLSYCGAQAPDVQAQQLWLTDTVALWHVGSSQARARTHVPCTGRQILNHCATREARKEFLNFGFGLFVADIQNTIDFYLDLVFCIHAKLTYQFQQIFLLTLQDFLHIGLCRLGIKTLTSSFQPVCL